jgi:hypothetical protein
MPEDESQLPKASERVPRFVRRALAFVFVAHCAIMCTPHIPSGSAIKPIGAYFHKYLEATGTWQNWDMFTSIPYTHDYDAKVVVLQADGHEETVGPIVPGLLPYDHSLRVESFLTRALPGGYYRGGYVKAVCRELRERDGHGGQRVVFRERYDRLRALKDIRVDGVIANPDVKNTGPYVCDAT